MNRKNVSSVRMCNVTWCVKSRGHYLRANDTDVWFLKKPHFRPFRISQRHLLMVDLMSLKCSTGFHRDQDSSDGATHLPLVYGIRLSLAILSSNRLTCPHYSANVSFKSVS